MAGTIYGTTERVAHAQLRRSSVPSDPDPMYLQMVKSTKCDAQGDFTFSGVADGSYFVATTVYWQVGKIEQGFQLMSPVTVKGGETRALIISI